MTVLTFTDARANLKTVMDRVTENYEAVTVTRSRGKDVVMISAEDWASIQETLHLLSSPKNAKRLHAAIDQLDAGTGSERDLIEP